ncbi:MAG: PorT family protein [Ignavibacteria bacterium]|nr:PorT family protein [Ignavibacteria bacterium]MCC7158053.1 PorT family protein [Ignavibacteria bacterium]
MNFKQYLLIITLIFSACTASHAQLSAKLGIEGGISASNVNITPAATTDPVTGPVFGASVDLNFINILSVSTGVFYVPKGYTSKNQNITFNTKLNYIEIPLLVKVGIPLILIKPYVFAGPTFGFNLSAEEVQSNGQQTTNVDISNKIESSETCILMGAGVDVNFSKKSAFFVQAAFSVGLSNMLKNTPGVTMKSYGIRVTGGLRFNL